MNNTDDLKCYDEGRGSCEGHVALRYPLASSGRTFPHCDKHWNQRMAQRQRLEERWDRLEIEFDG